MRSFGRAAGALMVLALCGPARAQMAMGSLGPPSDAAPFGAPVDDQRVFIHGTLSQFEGRLGGDDGLRWEGEGWVGDDNNRLVIKTEGQTTDGKLQDGQQELAYDRPLSTYFDLLAGARYDLDSRPGRGWGALGVQGLAPFFFTISATAYASDASRYAAKVQISNDLRFTQRLVLEPEIEMNLYTRTDRARLVGSGLSDIDAGLRLRYEITRKFAPYIGVSYEPRFGSTAGLYRAARMGPSETRLLVGLRSWF